MAQGGQRKIIQWVRKLASGQSTAEYNGQSSQPGAGSTVKSEYPPYPNSKGDKKTSSAQEWARTIIAGLALIVAFFAYCEAQRSALFAGKSAESAGKTASAAEKNVATAQAALQATIDNNRLDQRAWVSISHVIKPYTLEAGIKSMLGVTLTNSGNTPAKRLTSRTISASRPSNQEFSPYYPPKEYEAPIILPPGGKVDAVEQVEMPQNEIDDIRNGRSILYFFGKVSYDDVFGRGYCYTYCSYLDRNLINLRHCWIYNDETEGRCEEQSNK